MRDEDKDKVKYGSVRELAMSMAFYTSGSIFGPLIIFGAIGYFLDNYFQTKPLFIIISVGVAFVLTNVLLVKKIRFLMKEMDKEAGEAKENNPELKSGKTGASEDSDFSADKEKIK